ncbi:MAG: hypothetical protein HKM24_03725, partial [Gammaproteobacteria bacterium]|nr:hypothetical protein [Gammaproteobacteria bacterium]
DRYISIGTRVKDTKISLTYHDFQSEATSDDLGSEWGVIAQRSLGEHYDFLFKYASYTADTHSVDTNKGWVMLTSKF